MLKASMTDYTWSILQLSKDPVILVYVTVEEMREQKQLFTWIPLFRDKVQENEIIKLHRQQITNWFDNLVKMFPNRGVLF